MCACVCLIVPCASEWVCECLCMKLYAYACEIMYVRTCLCAFIRACVRGPVCGVCVCA